MTSLIARVPWSSVANSTVPSRSSTRRISIGFGTIAVVGEGGIGGGQRLQRDLARSERQRRHARHVADAQRLRVLHRLRDADVLEQAHRRAVARRAQRRPQAHRVGRGVLVLRRPVALERRNRLVEVLDDRRGRVTRFESGRVDERLERRAGLPLRLHGAIETGCRRSRGRRSSRARDRSSGPSRSARPAAAAVGSGCGAFVRRAADARRSLDAPSALRRRPSSAAFCIGMSMVE